MVMKEKVFTRDIVPLLAASFFYLASPMVVNPLIAGFSESLGAGATVMGLVGGLTNLCTLVFQPFSGNLADRISKYKLPIVGTVLLAVAFVIMCFTIPYCVTQSFLIRYVEMRGLEIEVSMFFTIYAAALLALRLALRNWFDQISFPVFLAISGGLHPAVNGVFGAYADQLGNGNRGSFYGRRVRYDVHGLTIRGSFIGWLGESRSCQQYLLYWIEFRYGIGTDAWRFFVRSSAGPMVFPSFYAYGATEYNSLFVQ